MVENMGLHRVDSSPVGKLSFRYFYEDSKGNRISKNEYEDLLLNGGKTKKGKRKKERIVVPYTRQPLWYLIKDTNERGITFVFLKYAKTVPIEEWNSYPLYTGSYFSKR